MTASLTTSLAFAAGEGSQGVTLDGTLYSDTSYTTPLLDAAAVINVKIYNPARDCILYEEQQVVNTTATAGRYNIKVGSITGAGKRTGDDPNNAMIDVFQNTAAITATNGGCGGYTPTAGDDRYLRVTVTPSATGVPQTLVPDLTLTSVPNALVAESVQGLDRDKLAEFGTHINANMTSANLLTLFDGSDASALHNHDGRYAQLTNSGSITMGAGATIELGEVAGTPGGLGPADAGKVWIDTTDSNKMKYWDGTGVVDLTAGGGGAVADVFGRTGNVVAAASDYDADQIDNTPAGDIAATDVQAAIDELDTEKLALAGGTMTGPIAMGTSKITGLGDGAAAQDAATMNNLSSAISANNASYVAKAGDNMTGALTMNAQNEIRFADDAGGDYISFKAPSGMSSNYDYTLPPNYGTNTHVLTTDGAGALTWTAKTTDTDTDTQNTLDGAYDEGGAGVGRAVTVDNGAIQFTGSNAADETLEVSNSGNGGAMLIENTGTGASFRVNDEAADTSPFFINDSGAVGIGTDTPAGDLNILDDGDNSVLNLDSYGGLSVLRGSRANGSLGTPTALAANDPMFSIRGRGYDGAAFSGTQVRIDFDASEAWTGTAQGTRIAFLVTENGTTTSSEAMRIDHDGNVGIGTAFPTARLHVDGGITLSDTDMATAADCDAAGEAGRFRYSSGSMQFCNGSAWQTLGVSGAGLTSLNAQTGSTQTFANGAAGTEPDFVSGSNIHTLNIPLASGAGVTSGTISKTDYDAFAAKVDRAGDTMTGTLNLATENEVRFQDAAGGDYAGFKAAATTTSYTMTLPAGAAGADGDVLSSTTGGVLSWVTPTAGTVTSITTGNGLTGGAITSTGTIDIDLDTNPGLEFNAAKLRVDASDGVKLVAAGLEADIDGLTAETTPDGAADTVMIYDSSATALRKMTINNLTSLVGGNQNLAQVYDQGTNTVPVTDADGDVIWNLTEASDFKIQDNGADTFSVFDNGSVSVGLSTPGQKLHVGGDSWSTIASDVSGTASPYFLGVRSRGTQSGKTIVQDNDNVASFAGQGYDGSTNVPVADINFSVDGTPAASDMPGRITFLTTPSGSAATVERMRITNSGNIGIGTSTPSTTLSILHADSAAGGLNISSSEADSTNKTARIKMNHYNSAEEPVTLLLGATQATESVVHLGGTSGSENAATRIALFTAPNNTTLTGTERLTVIGDGRVGIGTSTPDSDFTVNQSTLTGAARGIRLTGNPISGPSTGSGVLITLGYNVANNKQLWIGDPDYIGNASSSFVRFASGSGYTRLDSIAGDNVAYQDLNINDFGGNVGIGLSASSPTSKLDVAGAFTLQEMAAPAVSASGDGRIYFDSTSKTFKVSEDGSAYVDLVGGGGGTPTSRDLIAGTGLTGGGDLTADRTFNVIGGDGITANADDIEVDIDGLTAETTPDGAADTVMIYDDSATALRKMTINNLTSLVGGNQNLTQVYDQGTNTVPVTDADGDVIWNLTEASDFHIQDAGAAAFTVTDGGSVGIGTATPARTLQVIGDTEVQNLYFHDINSTTRAIYGNGTRRLELPGTGGHSAWRFYNMAGMGLEIRDIDNSDRVFFEADRNSTKFHDSTVGVTRNIEINTTSGAFAIKANNEGGGAAGQSLTVEAGEAFGAGNGGDLTLSGGDSAAGNEGNVILAPSVGNVGIGTTSPDASALLDVSSTTKGFLPPRMTETDRDNIASPAEGLVVYNTTDDKLNVYDGGAWTEVGAGGTFGTGNSGFVGSITYPGKANCVWGNSTSATNGFPDDPQCNVPTTVGAASATTDKKPAIRFTSLPAGRYLVRAYHAVFWSDTGTSECFYTLNDGTTDAGLAYSYGDTVDEIKGEFEYSTAQTNIEFEVHVGVNAGTACAIYNDNTYNGDFSISVTRIDGNTSAVMLADDDGDTGVNSEASTDEDILRFTTAGTERMNIDASGNINVAGTFAPTGTVDLTGATLTDNAISVDDLDFASANGINIPQLASDPGSPTAGQMYYNTGTNKMMIYNGSSFVEVGSGSGGGGSGGVEFTLQDPYASSTQTTVAHSFGSAPKQLVWFLENKTAELGYSPGDRVFSFKDTGAGRAFSVFSDSTNVGVSTHTNAPTLQYKSSTSNSPITAANWKLGVIAYETLGGVVAASDDDNDTKIQVEESADEDIIRFDTANVERMVLDNNGNLGLGISSPTTARLHLGGTDASGDAATIRLQNLNTGGADSFISSIDDNWTGGGGKLYFGVGGAPSTGNVRMTITDSGLVGIGTTTPNHSLDVRVDSSGGDVVRVQNNNVAGYSDYTAYDNTGAQKFAVGYGNASAGVSYIAGKAFTWMPTGVDFVISEQSVGAIATFQGTTGNVGIGTSTPAGTLDVQGGTAAASTAGRDINLSAEDGGTGNTDGGNITLMPGDGAGTGAWGRVSIGATPTTEWGHGLEINGGIMLTGGSRELQINSGGVRTYIKEGGFDTNSGSLRQYYFTGNNGAALGVNTNNPQATLDVNGDFIMQEMAAPALSASGDGRIYFDSTAKKFKVSEDNGAYVDLINPNMVVSSRDLIAGNGLTGGGDLTNDRTFTVVGGNAIDVDGSGVHHADTSSVTDSDNSFGVVIQDLTFDTYGHVQTAVTTDLDGRYYTETEANGNFVDAAGDTMSGDLTFSDSQKIIGGTSTTADLTFQTTTGVGAAGADMHFLVGNNGATEAMTILNNGNVGIGTTTPGNRLSVSGGNVLLDNNQALSFKTSSGAERSMVLMESDDNLRFGNTGAGDGNDTISFNITGNADVMNIDASGNVGIGTASPDASAQLEIDSTTKGFLPPRMTTAQRDAIASPADGLVIFNTDLKKLQTYDGGWATVGASTGGSIYYAPNAACDWWRQSGSWGNFGADGDCVETLSGDALAPTTADTPGLRFATLPAGTYRVTVSETGFYSQDGTYCEWKISDGTSRSGYRGVWADNGETWSDTHGQGSSLTGEFTYATDQTNIEFQIQTRIADEDSYDPWCGLDAGQQSGGQALRISVYRIDTPYVGGGGGGSDDMGDHTATQNIELGSNWLSGDGDAEGLQVDASGNVSFSGNVDFSSATITDNSISIDDIDFGSAAGGINIPQLASDPGSPTAGQMYYNTTNSTMMVYNGSTWTEVGSGGSGGGKKYDFAVVSSNTMVLNSGSEKLTNNMTEQFDDDDVYNTTTKRFTAPKDGVYFLAASAYMQGDTCASCFWQMGIYKNGSTLVCGALNNLDSGGFAILNASCIAELTAGDYIEVYGDDGNSSSVTVNDYGLAGYLVGGTDHYLSDNDGDTQIQTEESADDDIIRFDTAGGQRMVITATGNVGIGTASPGALLEVAGDVKLGNSSATCNGTTEGSQRYNSTSKAMEFCNGTSWGPMGGPPAGAVQAFSQETCPAGWLFADGAEVSRTTYSELFAAIGVMYGNGNGSTTFDLPDYRGYFLRGLDDGAGRDPDSNNRNNRGDGTTDDNVGTTQADEFGSHNHDTPRSYSPNTYYWGTSGGFNAGFTYPGSENTSNEGGDETRPLNIYVLYCIKQ